MNTNKELLRICVFGSRDVNIEQCRDLVFNFISSTNTDATIIEGEAIGVDTEARRAAEFYRRKYESYPPNRYKYGAKATFKRNEQMFETSDFGFAVWNGTSNGTMHTYRLFLQSVNPNKPVELHKVDKRK